MASKQVATPTHQAFMSTFRNRDDYDSIINSKVFTFEVLSAYFHLPMDQVL
jgi:hypothetical protein